MQFTLLLWGDASAEAALTPDERRTIVEHHMKFARELREAGAHVFGAPLDGAPAGKVLRGGLVTDGPFAETKEQLGGLYVIECADEEEALGWSRRVPPSPGLAVEVRSVPGS